MGEGIRKFGAAHELIHQHVRVAIETAVHEELQAALDARRYERSVDRRGYRNGTKVRTLSGPSGPASIRVPRARLFGAQERTRRVSSMTIAAAWDVFAVR